jgi:hypothetical protein
MNIPDLWVFIGLGMIGLLILLVFILALVLFLIGKNTHAFAEWKAKRKGIPLCIFFNDDNTAEWTAIKPEQGILETKKYGSFIVNPQSNYLDRTSKIVLIPIASSVGVTTPANFAQISDSLSKVIQDPKKFQELRKRIMAEDGRISKNIGFLKETINFSSIKKMLNAISPHNIDAKINFMVSRKLAGGMIMNPASLLVMALIGLGLIAVFAMVYQGKTPQVVVERVSQEVAKNASQPRVIS